MSLQVNNHFALQKFLKWGGPEWRTSKYLYAISSTQASMHQVKTKLASMNDATPN
jgi:hypothetical protein